MVDLAVNFQPSDAEIPEGYTVNPWTFDAQVGYGWTEGPISYLGLRDRESSASPDQAYDTMIHVDPSDVWEVEVPIGTYTIRVCMGDPSYPKGMQNVQVENEIHIDYERLSSGQLWIEREMTVEVLDERLTVTFAGSGNPARPCWIKAVQN